MIIMVLKMAVNGNTMALDAQHKGSKNQYSSNQHKACQQLLGYTHDVFWSRHGWLKHARVRTGIVTSEKPCMLLLYTGG